MITYIERLERMSNAQVLARLEADFLNQHTRLSTPCGADTVKRGLLRLRGVNESRADKVIQHALTAL